MSVYPVGAEVQRDAVLSPDGLYRYALMRYWASGPSAVFVMLNPSTADADTDDPTIRRCVGFARAWGLSGLIVLNLYALRSTDPRGLWASEDPVGPMNDGYLDQLISATTHAGYPVVAAWGAHAKRDRVDHVLALPGVRDVQCLGKTRHGAPRHPLCLPATAQLQPLKDAS